MIKRVTLDGFETGFVDEFDDLIFGRLVFARRFNQVRLHQLAAARDRAIEIVRSKMQRGLRQTFAEHDPISFDEVNVVEQEPRDRNGLETVNPGWARQVRKLRPRRIESERDEALKAAGLILLLAELDEMV